MKAGIFYTVESYVSSVKPVSSFSEIQFGISYIATVLKKAGHDVELHVVPVDGDIERMASEFVARFRPSLVCFTAVTSQFPYVVRLARAVKAADPSVYTVVGGAYAILAPEAVIEPGCFDSVCTGEGEASIVALAKMLELGKRPLGIPNMWFKDRSTGAIEKNPNGGFIENLDDLPFIDRSMWKGAVVRSDIHSLLLGRGCPFKCTYCSNHKIAATSEGKYVRFRSLDNVMGELREMVSDFPELKRVYFEVETFGANIKYAMGLCEALAEFNKTLKQPLLYGINLAVTKKLSKNIELLDAMKDANFEWINIGLESGSYRVRREILHRPEYSNEDLIGFSRAARGGGIKINLFVLMGIPTETLSDYMETIECARACYPSECFVSIFYPYPGTELHSLALELGLIGKGGLDHRSERKVATLDLPGFSKRRIRYEFVIAKYRIFRGRLPKLNLYALALRNFAGGLPLLDHLLRHFMYENPLGRFMRKKLATSVVSK